MKLRDLTELAATKFARGRAAEFADDAGHFRGRGFARGAACHWAWACSNWWTGRWRAPVCLTRFPFARGKALPSDNRADHDAIRGTPQISTPPRPLDDAARKEIAALPNVLEVNPEVRFTAEARREPISQLVMVSGMATVLAEQRERSTD